jgi:hypothetical protein
VKLKHSVAVDVGLDFAWQYRTDITTWNDPPATFALEGPFAAGSRGTTMIPGMEPMLWVIQEVKPRQSFALEMPLKQATLRFEWQFSRLGEHRTRLTQHIVLFGENASAYSGQVKAGFGPNMASGMRKLAADMTAVAAKARTNTQTS